MALFKKKGMKEKEELPELPRLPELPKLPESPRLSEMQPPKTKEENLPSFPTKSEEALPSIEPPTKPYTKLPTRSPTEFPEPALPALPSPKEKKVLEIPESAPFQMPPRRVQESPMPPPVSLPQPQAMQPQAIQPQLSKKIEPIYVRLDKFKNAITSFDSIKTKVSEIEGLLRNIKEQKTKEDSELMEWEREIQTIKARINAIDQNIFSKID